MKNHTYLFPKYSSINTGGINVLSVKKDRSFDLHIVDPFDMISGTNGLLGAADGAFMLQKEERTSPNATLSISGRDQQEQRLHLKKNTKALLWELDHVETELWKALPDPVLEAVASLVTPEFPIWEGSPAQLAILLATDLVPNRLSRHLNINASRLREEFHIGYENKARHEGRCIKLRLLAEEAAGAETADGAQCNRAALLWRDDGPDTDIDALITSLTDTWAEET